MQGHLRLIGIIAAALVVTAGSPASAQAVPNNTCNCSTGNGQPPVTICVYNQAGGATEPPSDTCSPAQQDNNWLFAQPTSPPADVTPLTPNQLAWRGLDPYGKDRTYYVDKNGQVGSINNLVNGIASLHDNDAGQVNPQNFLPSPLGPYTAQNTFWQSFCDSGLGIAPYSQASPLVKFFAGTVPGTQGSAQCLNDVTGCLSIASSGAKDQAESFAILVQQPGGCQQTDFVELSQFGQNNNLPANSASDGVLTIRYLSGQPQWSSPEFQKALTNLMFGIGHLSGAAGIVALFTGNVPLAKVLGEVSGAAYGSAVVSSVASAVDPIDSSFATVVTPTPLPVDTSGLPPAALQLTQTLAQEAGLAAALATTANRATGAYTNGDDASQQTQLTALSGFETQLSALAAQLPAQFAAWGRELQSEGIDPTAIPAGQVAGSLQSFQTNGLPSSMASALSAMGATQDDLNQAAASLASLDPVQVAMDLQQAFAVGPLMPPVLPASANLPQLAAVLPASRSVAVGTTATAFATIINTGASTASACGISSANPMNISLSYQTTNPATNALSGTPNTPVNIAPGASQSFVIALTPNAPLPPVYTTYNFFCTNANPAPIQTGLNSLLLSASVTPVPDIVALAASGDPGIVDIPGANGSGDFAVATVNLGSDATITASANIGTATLPVTLTICQTVPATGACMAPPAASVTTDIQPNATPTFGIFASGGGAILFDPANSRVFVQFADSSGTVRGETSVAVRTQ